LHHVISYTLHSEHLLYEIDVHASVVINFQHILQQGGWPNLDALVVTAAGTAHCLTFTTSWASVSTECWIIAMTSNVDISTSPLESETDPLLPREPCVQGSSSSVSKAGGESIVSPLPA
jgi:hypothetical protein